MKRQHRNAHMIMWLFLVPVVSVLALWVLDVRDDEIVEPASTTATIQADEG
jgi:hypothetical protein